MPIDSTAIRRFFPIYDHYEGLGKTFVYLDNAATTQKPGEVIDAEMGYYQNTCANVHRSPHRLGELATEQYEAARTTVAEFLHTTDPSELVFTSGTTGSINLLAMLLALHRLKPGDVILLTPSEHHSNLVPWQMAAARSGAKLEYTTLNSDGTLDYDSIANDWNSNTKVFAFQHASNVTGAIHDVTKLCSLATEHGALSVVDGAQAVPHATVNVDQIGCDFYAFSGHKCLGPTGIGGLFGKREYLESFEPVFGGGEMIRQVGKFSSTYNDLPYKFEAGTPNIAGAIGLGAAVRFLDRIGMEKIPAYLARLSRYAMDELKCIDGLRIVGPAENRTGAIYFNIEGCHPHDLASILDDQGVAIRAGTHCAEPLMQTLGENSTARASLYIYNTYDDVDRLVEALNHAKRILTR